VTLYSNLIDSVQFHL